MESVKLPQIIGITGRKFNGKDTLAEYLVEKYGYTQLSFAGPLKDICGILFGFDYEQLYGSEKETIDPRWNVTPRDMFQYVGTELFRNMMGKKIPDIDNNFWVKCLMERINRIMKINPDCKIVISDVRFENELNAIKSLDNNITIRVTRPSMNKTTDTHESELYIEKLNVDHDILNDGSLDDLYEKLNKLIK